MASGKAWPIGIVVALALFVAGNVAVIRVATAPDALAHDPEYYKHAVNFDAEMAVAARQARLGWQVAVTGRAATPTSPLTLTVTDSTGAPVTGATVRVRAFHYAHANTVVEATAAPATGAYVAQVPITQPGRWQVYVSVRRGTQHLALDRRVEIPASGVATR